ncbi:MAG: hypothetical protein COB15_06525 [Flavobacteriales bacterium]|nr:MAG: hypothetical protein COB15_06525 [Flavobacteriales bacterium]
MNHNESLTYRMKLAGFAWHYQKGCDQYPNNYYKEITLTKPKEYMMVCIRCKRLESETKQSTK